MKLLQEFKRCEIKKDLKTRKKMQRILEENMKNIFLSIFFNFFVNKNIENMFSFFLE